jgi:hypothetical protein
LGAAAERGHTGVRRIICDTGPLLHLGEAQALELLALAGEISIPLAVDLEMLVHQQDWQNQRPAWIGVQPLEPLYNTAAEAERALDRLAQSSLWVSARVLAAAKTALEQLY